MNRIQDVRDRLGSVPTIRPAAQPVPIREVRPQAAYGNNFMEQVGHSLGLFSEGLAHYSMGQKKEDQTMDQLEGARLAESHYKTLLESSTDQFRKAEVDGLPNGLRPDVLASMQRAFGSRYAAENHAQLWDGMEEVLNDTISAEPMQSRISNKLDENLNKIVEGLGDKTQLWHVNQSVTKGLTEARQQYMDTALQMHIRGVSERNASEVSADMQNKFEALAESGKFNTDTFQGFLKDVWGPNRKSIPVNQPANKFLFDNSILPILKKISIDQPDKALKLMDEIEKSEVSKGAKFIAGDNALRFQDFREQTAARQETLVRRDAEKQHLLHVKGQETIDDWLGQAQAKAVEDGVTLSQQDLLDLTSQAYQKLPADQQTAFGIGLAFNRAGVFLSTQSEAHHAQVAADQEKANLSVEENLLRSGPKTPVTEDWILQRGQELAQSNNIPLPVVTQVLRAQLRQKNLVQQFGVDNPDIVSTLDNNLEKTTADQGPEIEHLFRTGMISEQNYTHLRDKNKKNQSWDWFSADPSVKENAMRSFQEGYKAVYNAKTDADVLSYADGQLSTALPEYFKILKDEMNRAAKGQPPEEFLKGEGRMKAFAAANQIYSNRVQERLRVEKVQNDESTTRQKQQELLDTVRGNGSKPSVLTVLAKQNRLVNLVGEGTMTGNFLQNNAIAARTFNQDRQTLWNETLTKASEVFINQEATPAETLAAERTVLLAAQATGNLTYKNILEGVINVQGRDIKFDPANFPRDPALVQGKSKAKPTGDMLKGVLNPDITQLFGTRGELEANWDTFDSVLSKKYDSQGRIKEDTVAEANAALANFTPDQKTRFDNMHKLMTLVGVNPEDPQAARKFASHQLSLLAATGEAPDDKLKNEVLEKYLNNKENTLKRIKAENTNPTLSNLADSNISYREAIKPDATINKAEDGLKQVYSRMWNRWDEINRHPLVMDEMRKIQREFAGRFTFDPEYPTLERAGHISSKLSEEQKKTVYQELTRRFYELHYRMGNPDPRFDDILNPFKQQPNTNNKPVTRAMRFTNQFTP